MPDVFLPNVTQFHIVRATTLGQREIRRVMVAGEPFSPYSAPANSTDVDATRHGVAAALVRLLAALLIVSGIVYRCAFGENVIVPILIPSYAAWSFWGLIAIGKGNLHSPAFWGCSAGWHLLLASGGKFVVPNDAPSFFLSYTHVHYRIAIVASFALLLHSACYKRSKADIDSNSNARRLKCRDELNDLAREPRGRSVHEMMLRTPRMGRKLLPVVLAIAAVWMWHSYTTCAVYPSALVQVQNGMTHEQVLEILGEPGGVDAHGVWLYRVWNGCVTYSDDAYVEFDSQGRVIYAGF